MKKPIEVLAFWDGEASVWVAESDAVPGIVAEEDTIPALVAKLQTLIPELLDANGNPDGNEIPFEVHSSITSITHRQHH